MNAVRLLAPCALLVLAVPVLSCSSKPEPITSGGAYFQLKGGPDPDNPGKALSCPDPGHEVTISVKGEDGKTDKLIVDGADGATAACSVKGNSFSINVSNKAGTFIAQGTVVGGGPSSMKSTDAFVTVTFPGAAYRTVSTKCTVDFDPAQAVDFKLYAKVTCPRLDHTSQPDKACSMDTLDIARIPFFRFANCKVE